MAKMTELLLTTLDIVAEVEDRLAAGEQSSHIPLLADTGCSSK